MPSSPKSLLRRTSEQLTVARHQLMMANILLRTYGWVQFGTHAAEEHCTHRLQFSDQLDLDLMPLYERVIPDGET